MADVHVKESHNLSLEDARAQMDDFQESLDKFGVKAKWKGNKAELKGTGVKGNINITETDVEVILKLGMLAKTFGIDPKRLQKSIARKLKAAFKA